MSNKTFDTLRLVATIWAPIATFIAASLPVCGAPHAEDLIKTTAALTVLLNALVQVLRTQYNK